MNYELKKIEPATIFRLVFFITLVFGGILSIIYIILSIFTGRLLLAIFIFAVVVPLLALIKASLAYLFIIVYNIFAEKFGGIVLNLNKEQ